MCPELHNTSLISGCVHEIGQWLEIPGQKQPSPEHGTPRADSRTVKAIPGRLGTLARRKQVLNVTSSTSSCGLFRVPQVQTAAQRYQHPFAGS